MRLKLTLEYDGTPFRGWAAQPGLDTVETRLRTALEGVFAAAAKPAVAGRTDAGVHALGQVVSVDVEGGPPPERVPEALNALLPDAVAVVAAEEAAPGFHARHSALARRYRYRVFTRRAPSPFQARRSLWHRRPLDEAGLRAAAALLPGEHDFRAFTPAETEHEVFVRTVDEASWRREGDHLLFEIAAGSFLRHMVRTLVGTMLEQPPDALERLLAGGARSEAGRTAPPWGLYLVGVEY